MPSHLSLQALEGDISAPHEHHQPDDEKRQSALGPARRSGPPPPGGAPAKRAQPDVGAGVGELAVEAAGAAQPRPQVEAVLVVRAVAGAAERHDAVGVVASAVLARDDVRRIDGLAPADQAVAPADFRPLGLRSWDERERPDRTAPQRGTPPHAAGKSRTWRWLRARPIRRRTARTLWPVDAAISSCV